MLEQVPGLELFDAHTHLGQNDPDGMKQSRRRAARGAAGGRRARRVRVPDARARRLSRRQRHGDRGGARRSDGLLVPFCRVNPHDDPLPRGRARARPPGARGIKLHPRAEQFTLDHPDVRPLVALANERSLPVLIHAGRGIPALGLHAVELAGEFPNARLILAHAGI